MLCATSRWIFGRLVRSGIVLLPALLLAVVAAEPAAAQWRLEAWFGQAVSAPSNVSFSQIEEPEVSLTGHWSTRPWTPTWYYGGQIAKWTDSSAWAFQYLHHKMYMDNPPPEVDYFRITNGVNFFLAERLWRRHGWEFGLGAGPVFAVPVSSVRGQKYGNANGIFHSQYEIAGPGIEGEISRRLRLLPFTYGLLSLKGTGTYMHMHIANGHAVTTDFALHVEYGLSLQSKPKG